VTSDRIKSGLINAALMAGSVAVAFALAEIGLRVIGYSNPVLWTYDDTVGSRLYAGSEGWFRNEGEAYIKINSVGLRDREHAIVKPPNSVRIAVLGDSMTEALQVPVDKPFWSVLERQLKSCPAMQGKDVEVINFGVSGYGTAQELLTYTKWAAQYSPDVTILGFYVGNDVRNNSRSLEPNTLRPFFTLRDDNLVLDDGFLRDPAYVSYKSTFDRRQPFFGLRTFQLMRQLKSVVENWPQAHAADAGDANLEAGSDDNVFSAPTTKAWSDAWSVTEKLIVGLRNAVAKNGGRFIVVSIPIGIQTHPDAEARKQFMRTRHLDDLWYPDRRMADLATRERVDIITLGQAFQSYAQENRVYLYGFANTKRGTGHLNENGHRLIGEALARHLCEIP
jgi:hypothetical protein